MERLEALPEYIKTALARHEIQPADVQLLVSSDLSTEGEFCEIWLGITPDRFFTLKGRENDENSMMPEGVIHKKKIKTSTWEEEDFQGYSLEQIEKYTAEGLASSGMLTLHYNGEDKVVCRYTNRMSHKINLFVKLANILKEGRELTEADFQDDRAQAFCPKCGRLYPDAERKICPKCLDRRSLFLRVLSYIPRYKLQITLILICMLANSGFNLVIPYLGGNILFDEVLGPNGKYKGKILEVILLFAAFKAAATGVGILYGRINAGMTSKVVYDLKSEVFTAMQRLSLSFFTNKQTGNLMTRINNDANHLQYFFHDGLPYFIVNILNLVGIGIILFIMNWKLTLIVLIPSPLVVLFIKKMFPKLWRLFGRQFRKASQMNTLINDTLTGMRVVKAFGKESSEVNRFQNVNTGVYSVQMNTSNLIATMFPLMHLGMSVGAISVWAFGGIMVARGEITFGTLITFQNYIWMVYGPLEFLTNAVHWWSSCMNSAQRIFEIVDAVPEVAESHSPVPMPHMKGSIHLDNVSFEYEPNKPVLHQINLDIQAGEMIGLVGHSGAGKSTIINLISRLYDTKEGAIRIDGVNIRDIAVKDLRSQISIVLQDTFLFMGTVAQNIAYAKPDATLEEIIAASKAANAHDFILRLPEGYDTKIGAGGQGLSGGEKQRLSIARAILHNPRILILDEATSSVDTDTEQQIQEALERLVKGRTTIAIAHRLSTLRNADRLVVIEKGKLMEAGTHVELMKKRGAYFKLIEKQREALKIKGVAE